MAKTKVNKRQVLLGVGVASLLLLAVGAGVAARWFINKSNEPAPKATAALPKTVEDVQNLRLDGNSSEADKKISEALNNPSTSNQDRYMLYIQQGHGLADQQKWQEAIDSYLKAEAISPTYETAYLIAETWAKASQPQKAIEYYKSAITRIKDYPLAEADKQSLEIKIRELGGQP